jgi:uncharacterized protein (DUF1015 family)
MQDQPLLIADGHHRYEAALAYRNHMRQLEKKWTGRETFNYVMMYFANMSDKGLVILPTHRLARGFQSISCSKLEKALHDYSGAQKRRQEKASDWSFI